MSSQLMDRSTGSFFMFDVFYIFVCMSVFFEKFCNELHSDASYL